MRPTIKPVRRPPCDRLAQFIMWKRLLLTLRLGIYSLLLHKLRSALAVLGIVIGITAVIWLVALGEGVSYQAQLQIEQLGATNIMVISKKPPQNSSDSGRRALFVSYGVLRDDYRRFVSNIPWLQQIVPMREIQQEVRYDDKKSECRLVGCTPEYLPLNHLNLRRGRFLTDRDRKSRANVCVLADGLARQLFGFHNPIGQSVQLDRDFYVVVGQTRHRTPSSAIGGSMSSQDYNMDIYIPLDTLRARIGDQVFLSRSGSREGEVVELSQITMSVESIDQVESTASIVRTLLKKYHKNPDYAVNVPMDLLKQARLMRIMLNILCIVIAGISLLVGGIGIMNIMLATVTERTREIGIRRALGATRKNIIQQFLVEAVVLTMAGGAIGVVLGYLCGPIVWGVRRLATFFFADVMNRMPDVVQNLEPRIAMWSVITSLVISIGVGVLFGLYPAFRAARMDPIEALRHE